MRCSAKSRRRICGTLSVRRLPRGNFSRRPQKFCGTFLSAGYFLPGRAKNMKPVKAFASCTARCASYGAAVLHILRHCRKMLHKSTSSQALPQSLRTFTDDYRQEVIRRFVCICQAQNTSYFFLLILSKSVFFRVTNAVFSRETLCVP